MCRQRTAIRYATHRHRNSRPRRTGTSFELEPAVQLRREAAYQLQADAAFG